MDHASIFVYRLGSTRRRKTIKKGKEIEYFSFASLKANIYESPLSDETVIRYSHNI
jgi:hypothetical protein